MTTGSIKPKPRPRPRVRQPVAPTSDSVIPGEDAHVPSRASSTALDDEDAMFIRNRNRGAKEWRELNRTVKSAL